MRFRIQISVLLLASLTGCGSPDIQENCTMNGLGQGECNFTNTGTGSGSKCGKIIVTSSNGGETKSNLFCSGEVAKNSTVTVSFKIPDVLALCKSNYGQSWGDVCEFSFEAANTDSEPKAEEDDSAKYKAAQAGVRRAATAIDQFYLDSGTVATKMEDLVMRPSDSSNWGGPYLKRSEIKDPWGVVYTIRLPGEDGQPYSVISFGADRSPGGEGLAADINNNNH